MDSTDAKGHGARSSVIAWILFGLVMLGFLVSVYRYAVSNDYNLIVEASCNPLFEECYVRDCEVDGCPPNNLAEFKTFIVSARTFPLCSDNSCANICTTGHAQCVEILCSEQEDYACEGPTISF